MWGLLILIPIKYAIVKFADPDKKSDDDGGLFLLKCRCIAKPSMIVNERICQKYLDKDQKIGKSPF